MLRGALPSLCAGMHTTLRELCGASQPPSVRRLRSEGQEECHLGSGLSNASPNTELCHGLAFAVAGEEVVAAMFSNETFYKRVSMDVDAVLPVHAK